MKITQVQATNLEIPYSSPYRPAWQPGLVRASRDFTVVVVRTDEGLTGYAGTDGHYAGNIAKNVAPYLIGQDVWATEHHARVFRHAGGLWFMDQALWDLIGKAARMPLYRLWGAVRERDSGRRPEANVFVPASTSTLAFVRMDSTRAARW
jgi:L-alanine-DL-glutamate epimerase-like enolase superfamily enzyme